MVKKNRKTNPILESLIHDLKKQSREKNVDIWRDIAKRLEKPSRNWSEVNLDKIDDFLKENETALIPGKVLSGGKISGKHDIAAWDFSEKAKKKIKEADGKYMTIQEVMKNNPEGKNIRILG
ncbi:MAG: 50S ribosomal protein L18e [Candidatus Thermoplasmatota archaeon]